MEKFVKSEEFLSSKKEQMVAISQLLGVLLVAPIMIAVSWFA
tara:strand:- start:1371 stop:1496 length:126 start_codon:yes stop_codon:yes gene_type:complete